MFCNIILGRAENDLIERRRMVGNGRCVERNAVEIIGKRFSDEITILVRLRIYERKFYIECDIKRLMDLSRQ